MKVKKVIKCAVGIIAICGLLGSYPIKNASAATNKQESVKKYFTFVSTSGAICGVTIEGRMQETYEVKDGKVKYTGRSAFVGMKVNGNASITQKNVTYPKHYNSSGSVIKNFSDWKSQNYIVDASTKVLFSQKSATNVQYKKDNNNYAQLSFSIGSSDFVLQPYKSGKIKMSLGI